MVVGGKLWSVLLIWACAFNLGALVEVFHIPRPVGMLAAGLILINLPAAPGSHLAKTEASLSPAWGKDIRAAALGLVLLMAGLGIDIGDVKKHGWAFWAAAFLPSIMETLIMAGIATKLFAPMPFVMALGVAFIISAPSPSIITTNCLQLKLMGFSKRVPDFAITSCVFDDAICIIGANVLLYAYIPVALGNHGYNVAHGPLNAGLGVAGGLIAACLLSCTSLWNSTSTRLQALLLLCMGLVFVAGKNNYPGAGADSTLICGLATRWAWQRGVPAVLISPEHARAPVEMAQFMLDKVKKKLYRVWNVVFFPLLFGLIGATLNRSTISPHTGALALAYALLTITVRIITTALVVQLPCFKSRFSSKERIFMCCTFFAKATVQAAFATLLGDLLKAWMKNHPHQNFAGCTPAELKVFGDLAKWAAVITIFISVPLAAVLMINLAPRLLTMEVDEEKEEAGLEKRDSGLDANAISASLALDVDKQAHRRRTLEMQESSREFISPSEEA
jgi:NhaP-type Na+/H+ or K+/H+ antiporter